MRRMIKRLLVLPVLALMAFIALPATTASAHGENAQEAFLRMGTVGFWDVKFSTAHVKQGEAVTITGTAKVLETWPQQLGEPKLGFISVVTPGPVVVLKKRTINGSPAPHAIEIKKGGVYKFAITIEGRRPGKWHVHPIFGVEGAGSLIGPGQYVTVKKNPAGFTNEAKLASGKTVNLENIGLHNLAFWNILWAVIGLVWLLYWIILKPTVTRLPVTSQIPLNTDGMAYGLTTKRDHRVMNVVMGVTVLALIAGWVWQDSAYPNKMPQQVLHFAPEDAQMAAAFSNAKLTGSTYQQKTETLTMTVKVENTGKVPLTIQAFNTSNFDFPVKGVKAPSEGRVMEVSPSPTIAPGATASVDLKIKNHLWTVDRLMPVNESRMQVTGVLRLKDESGKENFQTIQSFVSVV